jgi:hypothetical protein
MKQILFQSIIFARVLLEKLKNKTIINDGYTKDFGM